MYVSKSYLSDGIGFEYSRLLYGVKNYLFYGVFYYENTKLM